VAYAALQGDKWLVVVDGVAGPESDGASGLVFSADGRQVAHAEKKGGKWHVVVVACPHLRYHLLS
jgi:hypothetical protein